LKNAKTLPQGVFSAEASLISPRKPSGFLRETALPGKKLPRFSLPPIFKQGLNKTMKLLY